MPNKGTIAQMWQYKYIVRYFKVSSSTHILARLITLIVSDNLV